MTDSCYFFIIGSRNPARLYVSGFIAFMNPAFFPLYSFKYLPFFQFGKVLTSLFQLALMACFLSTRSLILDILDKELQRSTHGLVEIGGLTRHGPIIYADYYRQPCWFNPALIFAEFAIDLGHRCLCFKEK